MKVLLDWGRLPHLMRVGVADVSLDVEGGSFKAYVLDADGTRRGEVPLRIVDGKLTFTADVARDERTASYLYEIVRQ